MRNDFNVLAHKIIDGVMYAYVKDYRSGWYGWYRLDPVELPDESSTDVSLPTNMVD